VNGGALDRVGPYVRNASRVVFNEMGFLFPVKIPLGATCHAPRALWRLEMKLRDAENRPPRSDAVERVDAPVAPSRPTG